MKTELAIGLGVGAVFVAGVGFVTLRNRGKQTSVKKQDPVEGGSSSYPEHTIHAATTFDSGNMNYTILRGFTELFPHPIMAVPYGEKASGVIPLEKSLLSAKPDGYNLYIASNVDTIVANANVEKPNHLLRKFIPIGLISSTPNVLLINKKVGVTTVEEFVLYAKKAKLSFGSSGYGTRSHLACKLFNHMGKLNMKEHFYKNEDSVLSALVDGEIQMAIVPEYQAYDYIKSEKVIALAVTSIEKCNAFPELPTIDETVVNKKRIFSGYHVTSFLALMAPPSTPTEIIGKLNDSVNSVLKDEKFIQFCNDNYVTAGTPMNQKEIHEFIRDSTLKWNSVLKTCGLKLPFV